DWSSDVCSSDLLSLDIALKHVRHAHRHVPLVLLRQLFEPVRPELDTLSEGHLRNAFGVAVLELACLGQDGGERLGEGGGFLGVRAVEVSRLAADRLGHLLLKPVEVKLDEPNRLARQRPERNDVPGYSGPQTVLLGRRARRATVRLAVVVLAAPTANAARRDWR